MIGACTVFILSVLVFGLSSRGLMSAVRENVDLQALMSGYSRQAVRIAKAYKLTAWGVLTLFLLVTMMGSLIEVLKL